MGLTVSSITSTHWKTGANVVALVNRFVTSSIKFGAAKFVYMLIKVQSSS